MSIAILDARGWQTSVDLETGEKISASGPIVRMVKDVLKRHPYPGDLNSASNSWVTDTALDLINKYDARFAFLIYSSQYFSARYTSMRQEERTVMISDVFKEAERFVKESGFAGIAVGTGDMTSFSGFIDVTRLDGLAVSTHWSTGYAGLYHPSPDDMRFLEQHENIAMIIPRDQIIRLFSGTPEQASRVPDYLMLARQGYAFRTISDTKKIPTMIPSPSASIPVHSPVHGSERITDIRKTIEQVVPRSKVALIVLEGVGSDDFLWPCSRCRNGEGWCCYEPGEAQCLTISSGRHRFLDYPTGTACKYLNGVEEIKSYPFSGFFKAIPGGTFGQTFAGRSIAVGNKSMFMHMVAGADLSVECFARNLYNQGTMAVIHTQDK